MPRMNRLTLNTAYAHAVDDVVREAEGHLLGHVKGPSTIEEAVEVDVYRVACRAVEEDVLAVTITESAR